MLSKKSSSLKIVINHLHTLLSKIEMMEVELDEYLETDVP